MKQQFDMNYMNRYTGELLTYKEMMTQWREEFDGDDDTNLTPYTEHYTPVIYVENRWLYVIDQTLTHYICESYNKAEGYCYISKESVKR